MIEPTIDTVVATVILGMVGGLLNTAYAYLKHGQPFDAKKTVFTVIIGAVASVLLVHAALSTLDWYVVMLTGITGGYFGVDVVDMFIKPPKKAEIEGGM